MNNRLLFLYAWWLVPILAATGIIVWVNFCDRSNPESGIVRFIRRRDRLWFGIMLLLVPTIVDHYFFWLFFRPSPGMFWISLRIISTAFSGIIYGLAASLFAGPAKKEERFSFWMALVLAVVLIFFAWIISNWVVSWRTMHEHPLPVVITEVVLILAYCIWRGTRGKNAPLLESAPVPNKEARPSHAILWLLVGLAPIPLLLILASSNTPNQGLFQVFMIICPICNLVGGIGCLGGIKNPAARIILGLFLAAFLFFLSVIIALFQACSHSGGI